MKAAVAAESRTPGRRVRRAILAGSALAAACLVSRLIYLGELPIFCDEATYVRWAQIGRANPALRFVSLTDGKQPLFIWLVMVALDFFPDPLLAGRAVSVVFGFLAMAGTGLLAGYLFGDVRTGLWAALLYLLTPMLLFHDRLALYEALTACLVAWSLFLAVVLARTLRVDAALGLGLVMGAGTLTKSSAFFAFPDLVVSLLLFRWRPFAARRLLAWLGLAALAAGLALLFFSLLLLTPWFANIGEKNRAFVYPLSAWLQAPLFLVGENLKQLLPWLLAYLTPPFALLVLGGLFSRRVGARERLFLLAAFLMPFSYLACVGKMLYPRYLLFTTVPLLALAARAAALLAARLDGTRSRVAVFLALLAFPLCFDATVVAAPRHAPLVARDRFQFLEDWPSGVGVREVVAVVRAAAEKERVFVATEGVFGLLPAALQLYFHRDPRVEIVGMSDLGRPDLLPELRRRAAGRACFVVLSGARWQARARAWPLKLVHEYAREKPGSYLRLYRLP